MTATMKHMPRSSVRMIQLTTQTARRPMCVLPKHHRYLLQALVMIPQFIPFLVDSSCHYFLRGLGCVVGYDFYCCLYGYPPEYVEIPTMSTHFLVSLPVIRCFERKG